VTPINFRMNVMNDNDIGIVFVVASIKCFCYCF